MTTCNKPGFPSEVHLDIENKVTANLLESNHIGDFSTSCLFWGYSFLYLPCNTDLAHLLVNGMPPKVGPCLLVNPQGLFCRVWKSDPKLMCCPPVAALNLGNNLIPLSKYLGYPPLIGRLFYNAVSDGIFSCQV